MSSASYRLPENLAEDIETYAGEVQRFLDGDLPAGILKAKRVPRGVYEQRRDGTFMVRVRIAAGVLGLEQTEALAGLSERFGNGWLHVTTRQDVQLHEVKIADTPEVMRQLMRVGLASKGGGGNTVRNVAACQLAGICRTELFDVTPFACAVTEYLIALVGSYNLPRKYKIAFSGCPADCGLAKINDVGFVASMRDGRPGFQVYVGGGMGASSRVGDLLEAWVPTSEVIRIAETIRRLFDRMGNRANRNRARLRFVFEQMSIDDFREQYRVELAQVVDEGVPECALQAQPVGDDAPADVPGVDQVGVAGGLRYIEQRADQRVTVPVHLPMGFIPADDFRKLAPIAGRFSAEEGFRTTKHQNLIMRSVDKDALADLKQALESLSFDAVSPVALERFSACAGASTCRLGLCLARGAAKACADALDAAGIEADVLRRMKIKISGCPNCCGQHAVADIGMFGAALRNEGRLLPGYRVLLGGCCHSELCRLGEALGTVPARALPEMVVELASDFAALSNADESFSDFFIRQGLSHFEPVAAKHAALPSYADRPDYYTDWTAEGEFSLAGRGAGECGAGVFEVIADDITAARKSMEGDFAGDAVFDALLATARALLITRGVDSQDPDDVFRLFEEHFVNTGLAADAFRGVLARGRGHVEGWGDALADSAEDVKNLLARVELLYSTLDAGLVFHPPEENQQDAPEEEGSVPEGADEDHELDLSGVTCPMNFVKAKLKLETLAPGDRLAITLDDGAPVQNVPASFKVEGQEVAEPVDLGDGQWRVVVKKIC